VDIKPSSLVLVEWLLMTILNDSGGFV